VVSITVGALVAHSGILQAMSDQLWIAILWIIVYCVREVWRTVVEGRRSRKAAEDRKHLLDKLNENTAITSTTLEKANSTLQTTEEMKSKVESVEDITQEAFGQLMHDRAPGYDEHDRRQRGAETKKPVTPSGPDPRTRPGPGPFGPGQGVSKPHDGGPR
jgi:hypothetical protein